MKKSRKGLTVIMVCMLALLFAGCGDAGERNDMRPEKEEEQKLIWNEKHMTEEGECRILSVMEDMTYICYYGGGQKGRVLTCAVFYKNSKVAEKEIVLPEGAEVEDIGIDTEGKVHVKCRRGNGG